MNHEDFDSTAVQTLTEGEATRQGILDALDDLVASSQPGDEVVFFYAGHGSQVRNLGSDEDDGMDETIVPSDAAPRADGSDGADDVRDKELRRRFAALLARVTSGGADGHVTIIMDSCHSGSGARGGLPEPGDTREMPPDATRTVNDPGGVEPPELLPGSLVFSAAQDDEPAREVRMTDEAGTGTTRGGFTWAFVRAMLSTPRGAPARVVFERTTALVSATGLTQVPTMSGTDVDRPLFGAAPGEGGAVAGAFSAIRVESDSARVVLQGGVFEGLGPGAVLSRVVGSAAGASAVRLRVTSTDNIARSRAEVIEGEISTVEPADLFRLDTWAAPPVAPLRLYVPSALPTAGAVREAASGFAAACGRTCVADPLEAVADVTVAHGAGGWSAWTASGPSAPAAEPAAALRARPARAPHLNLPPSAELSSAVATAIAAFGGIETTGDPDLAAYWLDGQVRPDGTPEYRWMLRSATARDGAQPSPSALPEATGWAATPDSLADLAFRLGRIHGWLTLPSPPDGGRFPLPIEGLVRRGPATAGDVLLPADSLGVVTITETGSCAAGTGPCYSISVGFSEADIEANQAEYGGGERFVYLFYVDPAGAGALLYPTAGTGGDANKISVPAEARSYLRTRFGLEPPTGRHTFFLLTTDSAIPDPASAFALESVILRARSASNPLGDLLAGIGRAGTRNVTPPVPATWSIDRLTVDFLPPAGP